MDNMSSTRGHIVPKPCARLVTRYLFSFKFKGFPNGTNYANSQQAGRRGKKGVGKMRITGVSMDETMPTVFVVDDDASVRGALARLIRSVGMQVETFASGREFLSCQVPDGPACLVLDVRLSGENGLVLQDALRTSERRLPIVFLTGHGTVPICVQAMKAGAVDFLLKPVEEQDLLQAIYRAIEEDRCTQGNQRKCAELARRVQTLTPREREVMALVVTGLLNKQIADVLGTCEKTIKVHRTHVMQKMQAMSVAELVRIADTVGMGEAHASQRQPLRASG
jgi:FixJ family two-component response regulator